MQNKAVSPSTLVLESLMTTDLVRIPLLSLSLLWVFSLFPFWPAQSVAADLTERWPTCNPEAGTQKITFVHVSDTHASYNPEPDGSSPMARIRGFADQVRKENPYTIFTNAGDDYEKGSLAEELSHGQSTRQVVQAMQYDLRTLGNHDFAWGLSELLQFSQDSHALVLSTNTTMTAPNSGPAALQPGWVDYAELTVGCVKIGFFGLVSKPWTENDEQYEGLYYKDHPQLQSDFDFSPIIQEVVSRHRHEVDLLVLISHLGIFDDVRLAEEQPGIDIILGGHTHTTMNEPRLVGGTIIVHPGAHAEYVARLDLDYNLGTKQITGSHFDLVANKAGAIPVDKVTDRKIHEIIQPYFETIHTNFARLTTPQSPREMAHIAARAAISTLKADAAFINLQSIGHDRPAGWLSRQDILDCFPVEREPAASPGLSSLYLLPVTGDDLLHARATLSDFTAYEGPETIDPHTIYTIALLKGVALNNRRFLNREIALAPPAPAGELWEAVVGFAQDQNNAHLALDERRPAGERNLIAALRDAR